MTWDLTQQEFESVVELAAPHRYAYFVKRCADWQEVWALSDNRGWVVAADDGGRKMLPVWPHAKFASACAVDEWATAKAHMIALGDWLEDWLPYLQQSEHLVAVFQTPSGNGIAVHPARLEHDMQEELELYE